MLLSVLTVAKLHSESVTYFESTVDVFGGVDGDRSGGGIGVNPRGCGGAVVV